MSDPELEEMLDRQLELNKSYVAMLGVLVPALHEIRKIADKALADMNDNAIPDSTKKALEELTKTIPLPPPYNP